MHRPYDLVPLISLRPSLAQMVLTQHPDLPEDAAISLDALNEFRIQFVRHTLEDERGELGELESQVVESLRERELLSQEVDEEIDRHLSFGQRLADRVASFGGSWTFILIFLAVLAVWIGVNSWLLRSDAFDPYPYILMNLVLSSIAALQAPVIMMSQNRTATRDRVQARNDYQINLKAELEIRHLHEKMDHLLKQQHTRLFEIQQIQIDLLTELHSRHRNSKKPKTPTSGPAEEQTEESVQSGI
jgi:uncharacterized membrane protein